MVKKETIYKLLAIADVARDPYTVVDACTALLDADPKDAAAPANYVRALVALGLGTIAQRLWANASAEPLASAALGAIAWSSRKRRFTANVAALEKRWPNAARQLCQWEQHAARYELHQSSDGNYHVLDMAQKPWWKAWLGGLTDHQKEGAAYEFNKETTPLPGPTAFDGVAFGTLLLKILTITQNSYLNYSCAVYIIEPDITAMAMLLHMHDLREWLSHPRLRVFIGPAAAEDFAAAVRGNRDWTPPQQYIENRLTDRPLVGLGEICQRLQQERTQNRNALMAQSQKTYAARGLNFWQQRFADAAAGKHRLRVLGVTTRFSTVLQYSMAELGRAIQAAGHEFKMSMEPDDHSIERLELDVIAEYKPDLLVQISRMRYEIPWLPREIPYICWDQDSLPCMRTAQAGDSLDALTYVAGHGAMHGFLELNWPRRNCIFCYPAAANHTYKADPIPAQQLAPYVCDFSYVSNAAQPAVALRDSIAASWSANPGVAKLFERFIQEILDTSDAGQRWSPTQIHALICQYGNAAGLAGHPHAITELTMQGVRVADRAYRHVGLRWVADWCRKNGKSLRLYGRGWEENSEFAAFAAGVAQPGEELRAIYQATKINLQIIETGFLHSRALDGMAAGGFFMCREYSEEQMHNGIPHSEYHRDMRELSQLALARGYDGIPDLEGSGDADLLARWERLKSWYDSLATRHADKAFHLWGGLPRATVIFPQLPGISFNDESTFARLAEEYLGNDDLRRKVAASMHQTTIAQFSYDARWETFLESIADGLASVGTPNATGQLVAV